MQFCSFYWVVQEDIMGFRFALGVKVLGVAVGIIY